MPRYKLDPLSPNGISPEPEKQPQNITYRGAVAGQVSPGVQSVTAGENVTVDNTDPKNPVVSAEAGGGGTWGSITGTLADQTDLQTELDGKITEIVEDTTPQLGGDLDANGHDIILGTDNSIHVSTEGRVYNNSLLGYDEHIFMSGPAASTTFDVNSEKGLTLSSNVGLDGSGTWAPYIIMSPSGHIEFGNTTQGDATNRYFQLQMNEGIRLYTDGNNQYANLRSDNMTDNRTFQLPDASGTIALEGHTHDDADITAAASATNYTPSAATVEGHLSGIDTALASAGGGGGQTLYDIIVAPSGGDYTTLGAAITAATTGQTIFVKSGTYTESAITSATTDLTIIGENYKTSIINMGANALTLSGAGCSLNNLRIDMTTGAIKVTGLNGTVKQCYILHTDTGGTDSTLEVGAYGLVANCFIDSDNMWSGGAHVVTSTYGKIIGNHIAVNTDPANGSIQPGINSVVSGNVIYSTGQAGNYLVDGSNRDAVITGNHFNCGADCGGVMASGESVAVSGNTFYDPLSVAVRVANTGVSVSGNTVKSLNAGNGFSVSSAGGGATITGNNLKGSGTTNGKKGIEVESGADDVIITGNRVSSYQTGVSIAASASDYTVLVGNNLRGNGTNLSDSGTNTVNSGNATA